MYKIVRNNRRFNNKLFPTYASARKHVRTWAVSNKLAPRTDLVFFSKLGITITKV